MLTDELFIVFRITSDVCVAVFSISLQNCMIVCTSVHSVDAILHKTLVLFNLVYFLQWALRKLGVEEWIVRLVQGMYANARSRVRVGEGYSEEFVVKVGVHQGSVLSPLLFIIVLEALSREFRSGVPWEDLYADDLVIIAESLEECVRRLLTWKEAMEKKGLRVNAGKTKILICGTGLDLLQSSGQFPCAVCHT